ncbi:hypothetical protein CI109_100164 [Kwoniella shandongensis]|uniref:Uncharacterized protein n=1 Tax=Kwoniella shandongensis TaxID=1734106 RepID=A0A5M6BV74_9TREE|nr:uncharacterized protein CI109_005764 [Kwoniella shandongensis]KAA5525882.1 hypothetical protein CI109_005764 [Kwoniella shandongensis]
MSSNPPGSNLQAIPGEEYELPTLTDDTEPGPSRRRVSNTKPARKITLHPTQSTANLLFSAPTQNGGPSHPTPRKRHNNHAGLPDSPEAPTTPRRLHRATFLSEDADHNLYGTSPRDAEQVDLPDFGHFLGFNDDTGEDHFAIAQGMRTRWKRKLYLLLEEPSSGREAFFVHILVTGIILFSAILTTLSTMPAFHTDPSSTRVLFGLDTFIVILFTIEYFARSLAHSDSWQQYYTWATSFFALLDVIAILPYYIEVAQNEDTSILFRFSILRTFRLLRVFRAFKYQNQMLLTIEVMYVAVRRSKDALWALSFFILLVLVLFSTLIYFAERGTWDMSLGAFVDSDGDPSAFDSIPKTAWFSLVTMSTVGYGEVVPKSFLGKLLTVPLLMFGLLLIALPSFVLGRNFAIVFDAMTQQLPKPISNMTSPRESLDEQDPSQQPLMVPAPPTETTFNTPLLPTVAPSVSGTPVPTARPRAISPLPPQQGTGMIASGSASSQRAGIPRMWDGGVDGLGSDPKSAAKERDLTNVKLAKNQLVLLEQIDSLRRTIDRQGEMLARLTDIFGAGVSGGVSNTVRSEQGVGLGVSMGESTRRSAEKRRHNGEEDQFALGDSDDER